MKILLAYDEYFDESIDFASHRHIISSREREKEKEDEKKCRFDDL